MPPGYPCDRREVGRSTLCRAILIPLVLILAKNRRRMLVSELDAIQEIIFHAGVCLQSTMTTVADSGWSPEAGTDRVDRVVDPPAIAQADNDLAFRKAAADERRVRVDQRHPLIAHHGAMLQFPAARSSVDYREPAETYQ
jgi:hypothetical protein